MYQSGSCQEITLKGVAKGSLIKGGVGTGWNIQGLGIAGNLFYLRPMGLKRNGEEAVVGTWWEL